MIIYPSRLAVGRAKRKVVNMMNCINEWALILKRQEENYLKREVKNGTNSFRRKTTSL